jgi:hypothetical protein
MVMDVKNVTTLDDASFHGMDTLILSSLLLELGCHFVLYTLVRTAGTCAHIGR